MTAGRPQPPGLPPALAGQEQLFAPDPPRPPSFDELCPPRGGDQLESDAAAAIHAHEQTTIHDFATGDA